jgi:NADH:ubiquinone reductase (H+-translocating)
MEAIKEKYIRRIVVVGGGFAGLNFLKPLRNDNRFHVTLVDKNNYHHFPPLLYQVGMGFIEPSNIAHPFRRFFQEQLNIDFHLGKVVRVIPEKNCVETETTVLPYNDLVIAVGTEPNYFGNNNVRQNALPLKSIDDAINLRNHMLLNFEKACRTSNPEEKQRLLTVVIAGGGPAGVEVAGMLAEMLHSIAPKEYPEINRKMFCIYLIQGGGVLLNPMSEKAQREAFEVLTKLGVKIILNTRVRDYIDGNVILSDGASIRSNALLWTSGVIGREVKGLEFAQGNPSRRISVDEYNRVPGMSNIYVIGDLSISMADTNYPSGHPQLAQVAIQQGRQLAANFKRRADGLDWEPFAYHNKGTMAIISKYKAVADLPRFSIKGFLAWFIWLFIHLVPIAGFRNKASLVLDWLWAFMTNDPTLRLIIRPFAKEFETETESSFKTPGVPENNKTPQTPEVVDRAS